MASLCLLLACRTNTVKNDMVGIHLEACLDSDPLIDLFQQAMLQREFSAASATNQMVVVVGNFVGDLVTRKIGAVDDTLLSEEIKRAVHSRFIGSRHDFLQATDDICRRDVVPSQADDFEDGKPLGGQSEATRA
jgi:hypothetical protein